MSHSRVASIRNTLIYSFNGAVLLALLFLALPAVAVGQAPGFRVQVGAQDRIADASALQETVARQLEWKHGVYVVEAGGLFKVRVGDFVTRGEASSVLSAVRSLGYTDAWVASDEVRLGSAAGGGGRPDALVPENELPEALRPDSRATDPIRDLDRTPGAAAEPAVTGESAIDRARTDPFPTAEELPAIEEDISGYQPMTPESIEAAWPLIDDGAIRLDGRPTERAWEEAGAGWTKRPSSRSSRAPSASVQFAYDTQAFYIATQVTHRDASAFEGAHFEAPGDQERVVVSVQRDGITTVSFGVTVAGHRIEYDEGQDVDRPSWQAKTAIESEGWSSEIRVPFELLEVEDASSDQWEVSVRWEDPEGAPTARRMEMPMEQFAMVFSPTAGDPFGRFIVSPYYQASTAVATTAWTDLSTPTSRVGGELEADLGSAFKAHAQIQPDYLNTRPDPARVNLSQYETRFEEQRGFFRGLDTEDNAWAPEWGPSLFYSRRVGAVPVGAALPTNVETMFPSDMLGVASFQGETGKVSYRALTSMDRTTSTIALDGSGTPVAIDLSPQSFLGVGRVQHRVAEQATLGATFTGVARSLTPGNRLADLLMDQAFTGTVDLDVGLASLGRLQAFVGLSHLMGSTDALQNLQLGSAHYFQRPDADHVTFDPSVTAMTGFSGGFATSIEHSGVRFRGRGMARNPEYNIQDAGYMRSADRAEAEAWIGMGHDAGQEDGKTVGLELGAYSDWNFGGVRLQTSPQARLLAGANGWEGQASFRYDLAGLSDDLTRGGPLMATPVGWVSSLAVTKAEDTGTFRLQGEYGSDELGGSLIQARVLGGAKLQEGFSIWLEPGYFSWVNPRQYVMNQGGGPAGTFGQRYVFGTLDQQELFARLGLNFEMKYGLTLNGYVEPFVSTGGFTDFGELTAALDNGLLVYGTGGTTITPGAGGENTVDDGTSSFVIPASDFNVRSFRSQVSLGWTPIEYATVSLAWLQSRSAFANQVGTPGARDLLDSARDFGAHLFVARVGYRLGLPR